MGVKRNNFEDVKRIYPTYGHVTEGQKEERHSGTVFCCRVRKEEFREVSRRCDEAREARSSKRESCPGRGTGRGGT